MNDFWIKTKFWAKTTLISVLVVYVAIFIYHNTGDDRQVKFWWWFKKEQPTSAFVLALLSFIAGALVTLLVRTTFKTMKQFRLAQAARAQREREEQLLKASRLQHKSTTVTPSDSER
jgi:uncharacterized integral membrane protein